MTLSDKIDKIKQLRSSNFILRGVFTIFETRNINKRIYPQDVFDREIKKLNEEA